MKDRLTGAIILVAVIVLLVPELLSGPRGSGRTSGAPTANSSTVSSEEPPLRSYTINLADDSHPRTDATASSGPAMPQPGGPDQQGGQPAADETTQDAASASAAASNTPPTPAAPVTAAPQSSGAKNSGATAAPRTANQGAATSGAAKSKPPATAKSAAAPAKPPATSKTTTVATSKSSSSAATPGGWTVQVGVFASRDNADRLASDIRMKGLRAAVSEVTSSGRKLYRVRVGPASDRAAAQELQARLKAAGRPTGAIVPPS